MAHQEQLPTKFFVLIFLLILWSSCSVPEKTKPIVTVDLYKNLLNKQDQQLTIINGIVMQQNNPFTGTLFTLYPSTKDTAELIGYLNGKEHGEWKKYYASTKLKEKRYFDNGFKVGEYITWWENGQKQSNYFFEADEYQGTCKEWNKDGILSRILNYQKGHEEGEQKWWYDNGKIKANYIIKDGRRYGLLGTKNCINVSDSIFKK
ncbi:MAG: hypothetical protein V9E96_11300 [Chitinophagaceae bacterium]|nr:toxin-antitoxin system YwqK family antitoxin [Chitinophagaceae bacterium]